MNNKILWCILLAAVVFLLLAYFFNENKIKNDANIQRQQALEENEQRSNATLNTKYQFKDGKHIFVGLIELPTPCHEFNTSVEKGETETFLNIETFSDVDVCAEVVTQKEFRIEFSGTADENIIAKLNNEIINLNIFEINKNTLCCFRS